MIDLLKYIIFIILTIIVIKSLKRRRKNYKRNRNILEANKRSTNKQIELNIVHTEALPLKKRLYNFFEKNNIFYKEILKMFSSVK
ncbi:MAG: hypothetical protein NTU73_12790 [Ignavibacteriae bacterium]|nr:hypothetical protein [Ignavibacteriota bacterium]